MAYIIKTGNKILLENGVVGRAMFDGITETQNTVVFNDSDTDDVTYCTDIAVALIKD